MSPTAWFEELLPGKWPTRIAASACALAVGAFGFPSLLPASYLPSAEDQVFLIRVAAFFIVMYLGALLATATLSQYAKSIESGFHTGYAVWSLSVAAVLGAALPLYIPVNQTPPVASVTYLLVVVSGITALATQAVAVAVLVHRVRKVEAKASRSFWEGAP